jgi:hypothetical protein
MNQPPLPFWGISAAEMLQQLQTAKDGLTADDAKQRLARYGSNLLTPKKRSDLFTLLLGQFKSPIILILLLATGLSFVLRDPSGLAGAHGAHRRGGRWSGLPDRPRDLMRRVMNLDHSPPGDRRLLDAPPGCFLRRIG